MAAALDKNGLRGPKADPKTPVILQTFGQPSARKLAQIKIGVPVVLLLNDDDGFRTAEQLKAWKGIVQGFGPTKSIVLQQPRLREVGARRRHDRDAVHLPRRRMPASPASRMSPRRWRTILYTLDVDALFTDNPDKFPRK